MDTSESLKSYDSERFDFRNNGDRNVHMEYNCFFRRQCYFETERHLTFFKAYTQRNCELECVAKNIIQKCKCSPFFMPSKIKAHFI